MTSESNEANSGEGLTAVSLEASLTVRDLMASRDWYRDVAGFAVDREHERDGRLRAVSLRAGAIRILLSQDDGSKGLDRPRGDGFSLQLTTSQPIDDIAARIKSHGGVLDSEPADAFGVRVFRLRDPDGFRWTISSQRTA